MAPFTAIRRDPRFALQHGTSFVDLHDPRQEGRLLVANLLKISVAGIAFASPGPIPELDVGSDLKDVTVRIGDCELKGDFVVRSLNRVGGRQTECGGLFYPSSIQDDEKLMAMIAAMEVLRLN